MRKPQLYMLAAALAVVFALFLFARTTPKKKFIAEVEHGPGDGHDHGVTVEAFSTDSILLMARQGLNNDQARFVGSLESSLQNADNSQKSKVFHQLSHFWGDSLLLFEPYAWYEAEVARLENSEKSLTFAAHLFLENLQQERNPRLLKWKALQAKDLFERSLKLNPQNDSASVGLGATYMFGQISETPMEGIRRIREVADRDSTNTYAQITLARGSIMTGQFDKAIERLNTVNRIQPANPQVMLMLADVYQRMQKKKEAILWYEKSLVYIKQPAIVAEIEKVITELKK